MRRSVTFAVIGAMLVSTSGTAAPGGPRVEVVPKPSERRVEVRIDGAPFTAYLWAESLAKPVLHPLRTAGGAAITRGFPPGPGESSDHPHHVGLWLNHAEVDGVDFWTTSSQMRRKLLRPPLGTIVHRAIRTARGGPERGELEVSADWVMPDGRIALREETRFVFGGGEKRRTVDRATTLTATEKPVTFRDAKDGFLALRLGSALEQPSRKNPGATGRYRSSEGKVGDAVWGTRARWVTLSGRLGDEPVTVAIFDHPSNHGHPAHWHARGYGLFAVNPLAGRALGRGPRTDLVIRPGHPVRFAYRVLILSRAADLKDVEAEYRAFAAPPLSR